MSTAPPSTLPGSDVEALRAACDRLVDDASDPAAARALLVRVWALGAATADGLLTDLCDVAASGAARTGAEVSAAGLLDALGRHDEAARVRGAVQRGLDVHDRAVDDAARAAAAVRAARAAVRLAAVREHRRPVAAMSAA